MSLCDDCIKGASHEGNPEGTFEKIDGINCYIATPTGYYAKDKAILFLTDVFGPNLVNAQLLADGFANNGYKTVIPDYFFGDAIPPHMLSGGALHPSFNKQEWFQRRDLVQIRDALNKVITALKAEGVTRFGATGYCFGARFVFDLAFDNIIHVSVTAHPSQLKVPDDLEKYFALAKAPLLINSCSNDSQFPHEAQVKADEIFGDGKFAPGYVREYFDGCIHGFAVRGDMSDPKAKAGKEGAFQKSVLFFQSHL
ncbi:hypothetical protein PILCRDRAFT_824949 [Piloderma croceum F 1598]|uniref:Dienelactone hydrolase domain-containing protein n=1 Tax=Piloderma croceum (strain F 1598) TaxID=765440 RepID=A0A0C3EZH8_PILCF|nr:hypothetical protein PILCRDRAFT_824949 [Piloderma croceum F 1598]